MGNVNSLVRKYKTANSHQNCIKVGNQSNFDTENLQNNFQSRDNTVSLQKVHWKCLVRNQLDLASKNHQNFKVHRIKVCIVAVKVDIRSYEESKIREGIQVTGINAVVGILVLDTGLVVDIKDRIS